MTRGILGLAELPYCLVVALRNACFDWRLRKSYRVDVPVISIGNITMGGTGKTPVVQWIAQWYSQHDTKVGLVSRGYRAKPGQVNDEAQELAQRLPGVPHVQNPDRVAAARQAIQQHACQLLVLDDAFQHRRIHRDLDIVLIDATEPFGFDHVFPRGTLREPLLGLRRADAIVLSRSDAVASAGRDEIRKRVLAITPDVVWVEIVQRPSGLLSFNGTDRKIAWLCGRRIAAFCGLGNPAGFRHTLSVCGGEIAGFREYPDHHNYTPDDLLDMDKWVQELGDVDAVVCTHKDLVKIDRLQLGDRPLLALTIEIEVTNGGDLLESQLSALAK